MLDKFLTGENVKVNGEIVGHRHIFRTLIRGEIVSVFTLSVVDPTWIKPKTIKLIFVASPLSMQH